MSETTVVEAPITDADQVRRALEHGLAVIGIPAPSSVSHEHYQVGFYRDGSALIHSRHDGWISVASVSWGQRESLAHAARCMGLFDKAKRAEMLHHTEKWVDGVHWAADGTFLGV